jgi:hypothetical protein
MSDSAHREHLVYLLQGGGAHLSFEQAFGDIPERLRGAKPEGVTYTPWRLLEHVRIAQWDILQFCRNSSHVSPPWPKGYWPDRDAPENATAWDESIKRFGSDLEAIVELVKNPSTDLFATIPWGDGQTILREALLVADHNAYHLGEMVVVRTLLGIEPTE